MFRRSLLVLGILYVAAALMGHAKERSGKITCECRHDCWCKRPELSLFRWVFPYGHKLR